MRLNVDTVSSAIRYTLVHSIHFTFAQLTHRLMLLSCFGAWPLRNPTLQLTHLHLHRQRDILCHLLHMGGARIITGAGQEKSQAIFFLRARPETDEGKLFVRNLWSAVRPPTLGCVSESYTFAVTRYRIYLMHSGDNLFLACSTFKADEYT